MIRISTSRRGTMIRARGKDAQRLFELFSQVTQEKAPRRAETAAQPADAAVNAEKEKADAAH